MKNYSILIISCIIWLSGFSQHQTNQDSIRLSNSIDSLISEKKRIFYNNKFFSMNDTTFELGAVLIHNITFGYNSSHGILDENEAFLDSLRSFLKKNINICIEVSSHTDNRGSDKYNLRLSDRRAMVIRSMLLKDSLISENRITYKGYGESQPIFEESIIEGYPQQDIKEMFYAANRRTVFTITKL